MISREFVRRCVCCRSSSWAATLNNNNYYQQAFKSNGFLVSTRNAPTINRSPAAPISRSFCISSLSSNRKDQDTKYNPKKRIITYLTDVEGDASYLDRYVTQSKVLQFRKVKPRFGNNDDEDDYFPYDKCIEFTTEDSILVYGGDVWDRGGHDLYVIRQLLDLQGRAGLDRVYFIMGNRDINKLRILQEMGLPRQTQLPLHKGVWWLSGTGRQGDPLLFNNVNNDNHHQTDTDNETTAAGVSSLPSSSLLVPQTDAVKRLKWMLSQTMGSPDAFELRRKELQWEQETKMKERDGLNNKVNVDISDMEIVESYRNSCHPIKGEMGKYLSNAHLTLRFGSILFVHGALPFTQPILQRTLEQQYKEESNNKSQKVIESFWTNFEFAMPWKKRMEEGDERNNKQEQVTDVDHWISTLNTFAQDNIKKWKQSIQDYEMNQDGNAKSQPWATLGGYGHTNNNSNNSTPTKQKESLSLLAKSHHTNYGDLMQYGMGWTPDRIRNPTIVYSSWLTDGMPRNFFPIQQEARNDEDFDTISKMDNKEKNQEEDKVKKAELFAKLTDEFMQTFDIKLIVCGHQPNGDMPIPIQVVGGGGGGSHDQNKITTTSSSSSSLSRWILGCDTSYSGDTIWLQSNYDPSFPEQRTNVGRGYGPNGRGNVAVSETLIEQDMNDGSITNVFCHGVLSDGTLYESTNLIKESQDDNDNNSDELIVGKLADPDILKDYCIWDPNDSSSCGCPPPPPPSLGGDESTLSQEKSEKRQEEQDKFWVKAKFKDGSYLLIKGKGFHVWNVMIQHKEGNKGKR